MDNGDKVLVLSLSTLLGTILGIEEKHEEIQVAYTYFTLTAEWEW